MNSIQLQDIGCVVIHHDSLRTLPRTLTSLRQEGLTKDHILVVDNSEDRISGRDLQDVVNFVAEVVRVPNRGYGNAVNIGIDHFSGLVDPPEYFLVVTHEVVPDPGAVSALRGELECNQRLAAVGPFLRSKLDDDSMYISYGGVHSGILGLPRHVKERPRREGDGRSVVLRDWLDGAIVMYRQGAFDNRRMREEFFMYVEEDEFHWRLRKEYGDIGCCFEVGADEVSNSVPPFLMSRNLQWMHDLHGNVLERLMCVPWVVGKTLLKALLGRVGWEQFRGSVKGWIAAKRRPVV